MSDPALIRDPIIEAATRALDNCIEGYQAEAVLAAVTPLIRNAALERLKAHLEYHLNARLCEMKPDHDDSITGFNEACVIVSRVVAAALKEQP